MSKSSVIAIGILLLGYTVSDAQQNDKPRGNVNMPRGNMNFTPRRPGQGNQQPARGGGGGGAMDVPPNEQAIGDSGIAWYTTWETGLAEAKRSNRPIFFMSAATVCSGVSGVF